MWLYCVLLRAYPRWFRVRYHDELVAAFIADRTLPRYAGRSGLALFWVHVVHDLITSAVRVRRHHRGRPGVRAGSPTMEVLRRDLRHAFRQLVRRPGFTAVAALSLAIGIGGTAVTYALVDGFVFHPFAFPDADRVVAIGSTFPRLSSEEGFIEAISVPEFLDIRDAKSVHSIAAFDLGNRNISGGDRPERVFTALAVTDLFGPFGLRPFLGRGFTPDELAPRGPEVAIISHRLWRSRFASDPSIVGRTIRVNGRPTVLVGVMPPELLLIGTDLWIPLAANLQSMPRNARQFTLIGRLAPEVTLDEAAAELSAIAARTTAAHETMYEEYAGWRLSAVPWPEALTREIRPGMQLLLGAVGVVLLIACANLSNLLLARSTGRRRELAVRLALGAGQGGVARQLLAEVALIGIAGAAIGLAFAYVALPAVLSLIPAEANTMDIVPSINLRVLLWAALVSFGSAALVAVLPVFHAARTSPQDALKTDGRGATPGRAPLRLRRALIVSEVALSVVLLVGAGLLVRSFVNLRNVEPGFDPFDVLTMRLTLPQEKYRGDAINEFFQRLLDTLEETPGIVAASAATQFPPQQRMSLPFRVVGQAAPTDTMATALATGASANHFTTLGVPLVAGRLFTSADRADAPPVVIVNQAFAARYLPGVEPIGQRLAVGPADQPSPPMEIVGVVANTQNRDMRSPPSAELFIPLHQQRLNNQLFLLVRTAGDAAARLPDVRRQLAALDPEQPVYAIRTLEDVIAADLLRNRFSMILFAVFAGVALALAAIGIYGVMSYAVSARTQEIGVRLAVGANRRDVVWLVLEQVLRITGAGLAAGLVGVVAAAALIRGALVGVEPLDPATLASATLVLGLVALVAGWLPAWRASRVDPLSALREE